MSVRMDGDGDSVAVFHAGGFEDDADVIEAEFDLLFEVGGNFVGLEVASDLAGDVEGAVGKDRRAEG